MSTINKLSETYEKEYSTWRNAKDLNTARRREYLRRHPDLIDDYDLKRAKILLSAVEMMDKSVLRKSEGVNTFFESMTTFGLGYAAFGGTALGFLVTNLKPVKKGIDKFMVRFPKSKNIVSMGITAISGVVGVLAAYPIYTFLSKVESKIHRKRRFETMEKELQDPNIFVVLNPEQREVFNKNLAEIEAQEKKRSIVKTVENDLEIVNQIYKNAIHYDKEQEKFKEKYQEDKSLYENQLTDKEIRDAKKDRVLLLVMLREINSKAQSYTEKMQSITDNLITLSFALGSLFTLGYERFAKKFKLKSSSLPAGMGIFMLMGSVFFATWAQKRAALVGKFKAKQDLAKNPEQLIYVSSRRTESINDEDIDQVKQKKSNTIDFLKEFFESNKEYNAWKKSSKITGHHVSKAMEGVDLSSDQVQDGKRLQKNLFKTLYKIDKNTQNYSSKIDVIAESIKFPTTLIFGTVGSIWGMKHLAKLRAATSPKEVFKQSIKYIGTISLSTLPSMMINSYFAKMQKMGARISDMATLEDLGDYRFFADYSRFQNNEKTTKL